VGLLLPVPPRLSFITQPTKRCLSFFDSSVMLLSASRTCVSPMRLNSARHAASTSGSAVQTALLCAGVRRADTISSPVADCSPCEPVRNLLHCGAPSQRF
jgi:hypothetical protein